MRETFLQTSVLALAATLSLAACAVDTDGAADLDTDDVNALEQSLVGDASTYFALRADVRRCASPACGGYFVSRVNGGSLRCADGRKNSECYVASLDGDAVALTATDRAALRTLSFQKGSVLVAGVLAKGEGRLGTFETAEIWVAGATSGKISADSKAEFVLVEPSNIRCFRAPCADKRETVLNTDEVTLLDELDLAPSRATQAEQDRANEALSSGGVIVHGTRFTTRVGIDTLKGRRASQFFTRFVASPTTVFTVEECEAAGGFVRGDIGDGKIACEPGEAQLGRVRYGRDGGVCCQAH